MSNNFQSFIILIKTILRKFIKKYLLAALYAKTAGISSSFLQYYSAITVYQKCPLASAAADFTEV